jgi:hypothetical protein
MAGTNLGPGMVGENVAQVQRWLASMARIQKITLPAGFLINGNYDTKTVALMKLVQRKLKLVETGTWSPQMHTAADKISKYFGGKGGRFGWLPKTRSLSEDRTYVAQQFQALFGRPPTETELTYRANQLQAGYPRAKWTADMERTDAEASVKRIYKQMMGREPTSTELEQWSRQIKAGEQTRASMTDYLKSTHEYLTKKKEDELAEGAEDQKAILDEMLDEFGLGSLKDWAWEQIKSGVSELRIIQNLRETPEYKARFPGMEARGGAGLPQMSESDYLAYERNVREIMRRQGMPPGFYDDPTDFAALIAADLSPDEVQSRVNEGYGRVINAPVEIRQAFAELYGADGDAALAALFVDPEKAEAALLKQTRAAEAKGWGGLFGIDFSAGEAETLAGIDLETDQLRQGLGDLSAMDALFKESVTETEDFRAGKEGVEAVFNTGGQGANELDQRRRSRIAAVKGGGGANITQQGIGVGAAD